MLTYGYCKEYQYSGDGTLLVKVRIPKIHGAYKQQNYNGRSIRNYVSDENLPWYQSIIPPYLPKEGDVVCLSTVGDKPNDFIVIGLTGGSYNNGSRI